METASSLLKSLIVAFTQYTNHKIERNVIYLQRQIDVLINKTSHGCSLKFFNPGDVLPAQCLAHLVSLVGDDSTNHTLLLKCLLLFNNLVSDSVIRESLHENFQLTPALARVIKYHGSTNSDTLTSEALNLLQKVTYGHRISFQEIYMEDLVRFLLSQICVPCTGLTRAAMGTLVNITRDNFSVQSYIRNNENMQDLSRRLTKLLGDGSEKEMLFSLSLLVNICLNEKHGGMFFNESNAPKTFQMIFNILNEVRGEMGYAVDLFKDILKVERLQGFMAKYEFLGACIDQTLNLITSSSAHSVAKIFDLLLTLCHMKSVRRVVCKSLFATFPIQDMGQFPTLAQTPLSRIADPLLATIHWAGQSTDTHRLAPLGAYDVLVEVYEELVFSHDKIHHDKHVAAILPTVILTLKTELEGDNTAIYRKCQVIIKALKLLQILCNDDNFLSIISVNIDHRLMSDLLQFQFDNNLIAMKTKVTPPTDDWSGAGVDVVLHVLDLVAKLKNLEVENLFISTMQNTCVVPFLANGLSSSNRKRVQDTFSLVCLSSRLEAFPLIILADALTFNNIEKEKMTASNEGRQQHPSMPGFHFKDKENYGPEAKFSQRDHQSVLKASTVNNSAMSSNSTLEQTSASIQSLIKKMEGGMEIQDTKANDMTAMYERAIQAMQTKEQHLQDLLEAKTLALTQADRMLTQYRSRKGQDEAENNSLRSLLIQSEKKNDNFQKEISETKNRLDRYVKEIEELSAENDKLSQIANMHKQLTLAHSELTERYENLQKTHQTTRQEHQSLSEMHEMLQKHNVNLKQQYDTCLEQLNTLQEERMKISTNLKAVETKLADTTKASLKWEYDYKRSEEERETMEMSIEKLRSDIGKSEQKSKQLVDKVSKLEFACNQNEAKISNYESQIQDLKNELSKQKQIQALINSLSSGNTDLSAQQSNTSKAD